MTSLPDPSYLVSGHATDTLSPAERRRLYRAALDDQEIFDQLVEEERWRQIFSSPGVRQELLEALAEPAPVPGVAPEGRQVRFAPEGRQRHTFDRVRGWLDSLRAPQLAVGAVAVALLAVVWIPRWLQLGEAPQTEFVAKSYGGSAEDTAVEQPAPGRATRGLQPKSAVAPEGRQHTTFEVRTLSYTLELNQQDGPRQVPDTYAFRPGDQFRLSFGVDFTAWLYLFNRASGDAVYTVLYPHTASERDPLPPSRRGDVLLPADVWLTMDDTPEDEQLVLVVSTQPWPPADSGRDTVQASELDAALARAEGSFGSLNWRLSEVDNRVQLTVEEGEGALVVVLRLLGERS